MIFFRSHQMDLHQDKKKINRGSGWKMKTVPLVAHVMNEDWGQAKAAARGGDAAMGGQVHAADEHFWPKRPLEGLTCHCGGGGRRKKEAAPTDYLGACLAYAGCQSMFSLTRLHVELQPQQAAHFHGQPQQAMFEIKISSRC